MFSKENAVFSKVPHLKIQCTFTSFEISSNGSRQLYYSKILYSKLSNNRINPRLCDPISNMVCFLAEKNKKQIKFKNPGGGNTTISESVQ